MLRRVANKAGDKCVLAALCIELLASEKCNTQRSKRQLPLIVIDLSPFNRHFVRDLWSAGSKLEPTASSMANAKQNGWCAQNRAALDRTRFRVVDEAGASSDVSSEEIIQLCFARAECFSSLKSRPSLNQTPTTGNIFQISYKVTT